MAICPYAIWKPLPANTKQQRMTPRLAIMHTAVDAPGPSDLYGWFVQSGLESHFFICNDGTAFQYMDTSVIAEANYKANGFAISFETEDDGNPHATPWTRAQLEKIVQILIWVCDVHGIPRQIANAWNGSGIGWHSMWGINTSSQPSLNPWTSAKGKTCPGGPRIVQTRDTVIPAVARGGLQPQPTQPAEPPMETKMKLVLAKKPNDAAVWCGNGVTRYHVAGEGELANLQYNIANGRLFGNATVQEIEDLDSIGMPTDKKVDELGTEVEALNSRVLEMQSKLDQVLSMLQTQAQA